MVGLLAVNHAVTTPPILCVAAKTTTWRVQNFSSQHNTVHQTVSNVQGTVEERVGTCLAIYTIVIISECCNDFVIFIISRERQWCDFMNSSYPLAVNLFLLLSFSGRDATGSFLISKELCVQGQKRTMCVCWCVCVC